MTYGIPYATASYRASNGDRFITHRVLADDTRESQDAYAAELAEMAAPDAYVHVTVRNVTSTDDIAKVTEGYWFTPDTMRSFRSRIVSGQRIIGHKFYFLSSESTDWNHTGRAYSVRVWDADTDSIDTVGESFAHRTAASARRALANIPD